MTLKFKANGRCATVTQEPPAQPITAGSVGILAAFELSSDYNGLVVTAVFRAGGVMLDVLLTADLEPVPIPWEVLAAPALSLDIGVVGATGDGTIVIPTVWAKAGRVVPGAEASGISPEDPTADIGAQIVEQARAAAAAAESSAESAGNAQEAAETAQDKAEDAQDAAEAAQDKAEDAQNAAEAAQQAAEAAASHYPQIINGTWWVWDVSAGEYVDTGVPASGGGGGTSDYDQLSNRPQINSHTLTGNQTAAQLGLGTYSKPSGGIPKSDLAGAVQTSLEKADSALQAVPDTYRTAAAQDAIDADKLDKTGDGSNVTVAFSAASSRANISTGEKLSVIMGKIAKWLGDLGTAAFRAATSSITQGSTALIESGAVFTALAAKYAKPSGGIPKSDLASAVQLSLDKADSALQTAPVTSVNNQTGAVTLSFADVGAMPSDADLDDIPDGATYKRATGAQLGQIATNAQDIDNIEGKIPAAASSSNKLADKAYVDDQVSTNTAHFRGNWATWSAVPTSAADYPADDDGSTTPTSNDYMVIQDASGYPVASGDPALDGTWRFKYSGLWSTAGKNGWKPEYQVNETPLTEAQLAALNSGATAQNIASIADKLDKTGDGSNVTVAFSAASSRANISTGEKLSVIMGKIAKWLGDLGTAAFRAATSSITQGSTALIESGAVFTALAAKYAKPSGGIPKSDLASAVQSSLDKADTALQSVPNTYRTAAAQDLIDEDKQAKITDSGILKGDGAGGVSAAVAGTDYATPNQIPSVPGAYTSNPAALGTASPGSSTSWSRGDHVHPMPSAADIGAEPAVEVVTVSGSTPSINAVAGKRYVCGEVATLTIAVPASGIIDVVFTSGTTATVLTITPASGHTVSWANSFDPTSLDASTTYELNIMDDLGVAASWT